jgi:hypothetical protein
MLLDVFDKFAQQSDEWDMYITGAAGTGKTTELADLVRYCTDNGINALVVAYTHKACGILRSKLPSDANISTLHSFLKKRPGINDLATNVAQIDVNRQTSKPKRVELLFIDEFSMVGESDLMSIRELQDPDYDGAPEMKVVWIGDENQLPPVMDAPAVKPRKPYWEHLTEIKRQASDNPLITPLSQLVSFIGGAEPEPLVESDMFIRNQDIVEWYINDNEPDSVILAYTNERVQSLNAEIADREHYIVGDNVFSPTSRHHYDINSIVPWHDVRVISLPFGEPLMLNSKYNTLEHLVDMDCCDFIQVSDPSEEPSAETDITIAIVFGHHNYKVALQELKVAAAEANKAIESEHNQSPASWAKGHPKYPLARARAKAWRDFLTFKDCVMCIDFPHAMTVHKSQGSTYKNVYLDTDNLSMCADFDYKLYLKLMYVALSRASNQVVTS